MDADCIVRIQSITVINHWRVERHGLESVPDKFLVSCFKIVVLTFASSSFFESYCLGLTLFLLLQILLLILMHWHLCKQFYLDMMWCDSNLITKFCVVYD